MYKSCTGIHYNFLEHLAAALESKEGVELLVEMVDLERERPQTHQATPQLVGDLPKIRF